MSSVIDKKIKVPLHYQIYLDLLKKIQAGVWKAGDKIPSEAELEKIYDVSRITVRAAIEMLAQEGIVEKNRGKKGTVVCQIRYTYDMGRLTSFTDDVHLYGERAGSELLQFQELLPRDEIAEYLELEKGEQVYYIERKRYRQGMIVGMHKAYIKKLPGLKLSEEQFRSDASLYAILKQFGIIPTTAKEILEVRIPSKRILDIMMLPSGTAVFHKKRVTYSINKAPFEFVEMFYNPDYYRYEAELHLDT